MEDQAETAIILKVGNRFFSRYANKRIITAWSLAGSHLFAPWKMEEVHIIEKVLENKGYKSERKIVRITL